jgi:hypothetical protein
MSSLALCASHRSRILLVASVFVAAGLSGCNSSPSADPAPTRKAAAGGSETGGSKFDTNREFKKLSLAKFAGRVTIDGQPPKPGCKVFLILNDPNHLDENAHGILPKWYEACDADGNFAFSVYDKGDGAPAGKHVVTFLELHEPPAKSTSSKKSSTGKAGGALKGGGGTGNQRYMQPDELKNLYSDPDINVKDQRFNLDLQPPGKDDYHFDLAVAGKTAAKRAPHAVSTLIIHK